MPTYKYSETHKAKALWKICKACVGLKQPLPCGIPLANHLPRTWDDKLAAAGCGDGPERRALLA